MWAVVVMAIGLGASACRTETRISDTSSSDSGAERVTIGDVEWYVDYDAALEINPEEENVLHAVGLARLEIQDLEGAESAFEHAARINPERTINQTLLERTRRLIRTADDS